MRGKFILKKNSIDRMDKVGGRRSDEFEGTTDEGMNEGETDRVKERSRRTHPEM